MIAQFGDIESFIYSTTERGHHVAQLFIGENFAQRSLLGVQDFTAQGKNRLKGAVPSLFRRTARRISFDDEEFAILWIC